MPKAIPQRRATEIAFSQRFFARVAEWADPSEELLNLAEREAARYGLSALDALHVAAARTLSADELVTTEGIRKPIHRTTGVRVVAV